MLFGFFNLGFQELLILLIGGLCFAGFVGGIVLLVVFLIRQQGRDMDGNRGAALDAENQRLREEVTKLKKDGAE